MSRPTATFTIDGLGEFEIYTDLTMAEKIRLRSQVKNFLGEQFEQNQRQKRQWYGKIYRAAEVALGIANQPAPTDENAAKEQEKRVDDFVRNSDMFEKDLIAQLNHDENLIDFALLFPIICKRSPNGFNTNLIDCTDDALFHELWARTIAARMPDESKKKS